jgi:hypothetical protein
MKFQGYMNKVQAHSHRKPAFLNKDTLYRTLGNHSAFFSYVLSFIYTYGSFKPSLAFVTKEDTWAVIIFNEL